MKKSYWIKKVQASSVQEALKLERKAEVTDIWVDDKEEGKGQVSAIGFEVKGIDREESDIVNRRSPIKS